MKLYGYEKDSTSLVELKEASLVASAAELRSLSRLLALVADQKDGILKKSEDHIHFKDFHAEVENCSADIIVIVE